MVGPAVRFVAETDALFDARLEESGEYLHEYTGILAETDERVRIRTLAPELAEIDAAVDAFAEVSDRWYNASANATILTIRDRGTEPRPWIAVPDHGGDTLATLQPDLSPEAIETVISETADALRTLGLYNTVHGHLSPNDIFVSERDTKSTTPTIQVGNFGLEAAVMAAVDEFKPTAYTAPELRDDPDQPTERTDVYGLGAVTHFVLTGRPPDVDAGGEPSPPGEYTETASPALDDVVLQALSEQPADRQESSYAFSRAFLGSFDPDSFEGGWDGEKTESADAATESEGEETGGDPDDVEEHDAGETPSSNGDDDTRVTRRAAIGLLGLGGIGGVASLIAWPPGSGTTPPTADDAGPVEKTDAETNQAPRDGATTQSAESETTETPTRADEPTATEAPSGTSESGGREPTAEFGSNVYTVDRGETVAITIEFTDTNVATLQIGTIEDGGYALVAELEDDDQDGVATVEFDSYLAANGTPSDTLRTDSETVISAVDTADGSFEGNQPAGSDLLYPSDYAMLVAAGEETSATIRHDEVDALATLSLSEG